MEEMNNVIVPETVETTTEMIPMNYEQEFDNLASDEGSKVNWKLVAGIGTGVLGLGIATKKLMDNLKKKHKKVVFRLPIGLEDIPVEKPAENQDTDTDKDSKENPKAKK